MIHRSEAAGEGGIRMRDIADMTADSTSAWVASKILWARLSSHDLSRSARKTYEYVCDISIHLMYSCVLQQAAVVNFHHFLPCSDLIPGVADVYPRTDCKHRNCCRGPCSVHRAFRDAVPEADSWFSEQHQFTNYREIVVPGDLSQADITRASFQGSAFQVRSLLSPLSRPIPLIHYKQQDYVRTWTLAPFASSDSQASVISFRWQNDDIYFAEATDLQLAPGGRGKGTFELNTTDAQMERRELARRDALDATTGTSGTVAGEPTLGQVLRCVVQTNRFARAECRGLNDVAGQVPEVGDPHTL